MASSTNQVRPQADWLANDLNALRAAIEAEPERLSSLGDYSDTDRQNYLSVVAEFFWRSYGLAGGAQKVLAAHLRTPLLVVQRALFESTISVMYLTGHPNPVQEALIYRACSILREIDLVPLDAHGLASSRAALAALPNDLVTEAERRKRGRGWTGKKWKQLGVAVGFNDYSIYEYLSEYAHGKIGAHVRVGVNDEGGCQLAFGDPFAPGEHDYAANFTHRMLFHSFDALRLAFDWNAVNLRTNNPYDWFHTMEAALNGDEEGAEPYGPLPIR